MFMVYFDLGLINIIQRITLPVSSVFGQLVIELSAGALFYLMPCI